MRRVRGSWTWSPAWAHSHLIGEWAGLSWSAGNVDDSKHHRSELESQVRKRRNIYVANETWRHAFLWPSHHDTARQVRAHCPQPPCHSIWREAMSHPRTSEVCLHPVSPLCLCATSLRKHQPTITSVPSCEVPAEPAKASFESWWVCIRSVACHCLAKCSQPDRQVRGALWCHHGSRGSTVRSGPPNMGELSHPAPAHERSSEQCVSILFSRL